MIDNLLFKTVSYIPFLDDAEPCAGQIVPLSSDRRSVIDFVALERASMRGTFRELSQTGDKELSKAVDLLKRSLYRGSNTGVFRPYRWSAVGLPAPEPGCEYYRVAITSLPKSSPSTTGDTRTFLVMLHQQKRQIRDLYFCKREPVAGTIQRVSVK